MIWKMMNLNQSVIRLFFTRTRNTMLPLWRSVSFFIFSPILYFLTQYFVLTGVRWGCGDSCARGGCSTSNRTHCQAREATQIRGIYLFNCSFTAWDNNNVYTTFLIDLVFRHVSIISLKRRIRRSIWLIWWTVPMSFATLPSPDIYIMERFEYSSLTHLSKWMYLSIMCYCRRHSWIVSWNRLILNSLVPMIRILDSLILSSSNNREDAPSR